MKTSPSLKFIIKKIKKDKIHLTINFYLAIKLWNSNYTKAKYTLSSDMIMHININKLKYQY